MDDLVVISITISGFKIARVLVDGGSSANVIYRKYFVELYLQVDMLKHYPNTLVRFFDDRW